MLDNININTENAIAIIGLGYVGLPLALAFSKQCSVIGFDVSKKRIESLSKYQDDTREVDEFELRNASNIVFTCCPDLMSKASVFIITVPTPVDDNKVPDLSMISSATELVGKVLKYGDIVIYESTVYPGTTEEFCAPILEKHSGLKFNEGFFCGYSPERVNPGDKTHSLSDIVKVTSGSTLEVAEKVDVLYRSIIDAGTYKAPSIKVAEAAKVIENTQRDLNIALMNELSIIFHRLGLNTVDVLSTAETKWNFLPFRPGLVGGHCIGVDPYYLTYKAKQVGLSPDVILAGRAVNDGMSDHVTQQFLRTLKAKTENIKTKKVLIFGLTFKENCPDTRNSKVVNLAKALQGEGVLIDVYDPWVNQEAILAEHRLNVCKDPEPQTYDGLILAVPHNEFITMGVETILTFGKPETCIFFDLKSVFPSKYSDFQL